MPEKIMALAGIALTVGIVATYLADSDQDDNAPSLNLVKIAERSERLDAIRRSRDHLARLRRHLAEQVRDRKISLRAAMELARPEVMAHLERGGYSVDRWVEDIGLAGYILMELED